MVKDIIVVHNEELEEKKKTVSKDGAERLHLLSDFDRTLTTAFVGGKSVPSLISILRDGNYLTSDYAKKANELYDKYHPIEIDPKIPLEEKKKLMLEWWLTHSDFLISSGLNKKDLKSIAESGKVKLRDGFSEFVDFLKVHNIPLVIMSSSGLGGEVISMFLDKVGKLYDNIHIVSNSYEWDKDGDAVAFKKPVIHVMNKDETAIQNFPVFEIIKNRKNVLLLGDSLGDAGMIEGFDYDNLIKIGFLNEGVKENLEQYKMNYDVIILNDSSLDYINSLLREVIK